MIEQLNLPKRQIWDIIGAEMKETRRPVEPFWQEVAEYIQPYRLRLELSEWNRSERRNQSIINSTSTMGIRTLGNGMMYGIHSPSQPWINFVTEDPDLREFGPVKNYFDDLTSEFLAVWDGSTPYVSLPRSYKDMAGFGVGAMSIEEDLKYGNVIHTRTYKPGSYWIARDDFGRVTVFRREFKMTVRQLIETFGRHPEKTGNPDFSNFSKHVQELWRGHQLEEWVSVCHMIAPNAGYDARKSKSMSRHMPFTSCYYELGGVGSDNYLNDGEKKELQLSEKGYLRFPIVVGRWERDEELPWGGDCPGMQAIGDTRQLQFGERRIDKAIDKVLDPPLIGPASLKTQGFPGVPGRMTAVPMEVAREQLVRPVYQINPDVAAQDVRQQQIERRINRAFHVDLFQMLTLMAEREMTATEIAERKQEKMVEIAPTLVNVNYDMLDPAVEITVDVMNRQRRAPPPPPDLVGKPIRIRYEGIMAQAIRATGLSAIDRTASFVLNAVKMTGNPELGEKVDWDQAFDEYALRAGAPARMIVPDDVLAERRAARAQAQRAAQGAEQAEQVANTVKTLSEADIEKPSALRALATALPKLARRGA